MFSYFIFIYILCSTISKTQTKVESNNCAKENCRVRFFCKNYILCKILTQIKMNNEPILEALNFTLDSDLHFDDVRAPSSSSSGPLYSRRGTATPKNSKNILPSSVILGEDKETSCLFKGCNTISPSFAIKENKDNFLAHLLLEHKLVIEDVDKIANLHKYVIYWKEKFLTAPITEFCVGFNMNDETYYMLTHALEEDKVIRNKLWNGRLEVILEVNREEREQKDFSRQCFFCREIFTGNRSALFEHMQKDHSFRFGNPDNIVFVEEILELINGKLNDLICLHCEKVFKDKTILRDHMRKKGHKRLNSNNPEYNRYYIINYLEPGKNWKELEEDHEDERVEEEWIESNEESTNIVCLLCSHQSSDFDEILLHMKTQHHFDFLKITENLDFYQKVKVVNFVRRTVFLSTCLFCSQKFLERTSLIQHLANHFKSGPSEFPPEKIWNQPEYFFPTYENDNFLVLLDKDINADEADDDIKSTISSEEEQNLVIPEDLPKLSSSLQEHDLDMDSDFDYATTLKNNL